MVCIEVNQCPLEFIHTSLITMQSQKIIPGLKEKRERCLFLDRLSILCLQMFICLFLYKYFNFKYDGQREIELYKSNLLYISLI